MDSTWRRPFSLKVGWEVLFFVRIADPLWTELRRLWANDFHSFTGHKLEKHFFKLHQCIDISSLTQPAVWFGHTVGEFNWQSFGGSKPSNDCRAGWLWVCCKSEHHLWYWIALILIIGYYHNDNLKSCDTFCLLKIHSVVLNDNLRKNSKQVAARMHSEVLSASTSTLIADIFNILPISHYHDNHASTKGLKSWWQLQRIQCHLWLTEKPTLPKSFMMLSSCIVSLLSANIGSKHISCAWQKKV